MGGSLFPLPHSTQEGNGVAVEVRRFQDPPWAHLWRRGGHLALGCACVGVRVRVLRPHVRGALRACVCAVRAPCAPRVHGRGGGGGRATWPQYCVPVSARPPAAAQHRLRPRVCMRGVSERVGGPDGVGYGEQRRGRRRSQDALAPVPAPRPRCEAAAVAGRRPLPNSWPRPRGLLEGRRGRREGPAGVQAEPRVLPQGCGPRGAAAEGRGPRAGGRRPSRSPENKRRRRLLLRGQNNLRWRRPKVRPRPRSPSP